MTHEIPPPDRYLDCVFGSDGYLSRAFAGYEPRAGQVSFAHAVDRAIVEKRHLLAEAGTGTGKSVGYCVPATYHAVRTKTPVIIVTANIALQEQIAHKDLPMLQKILPWPFTYQLVKGRNNYLCVDRFLKKQAEKVSRQESFSYGSNDRKERPDLMRQRAILTDWANESMIGGIEQETGDVSELPFEPDPQVWRDFSVGTDDCKGRRCKRAKDCFSQTARTRSKQVDVVVTNYHMLFAHLQIYLKTGIDLVLPPFEIVVMDECFVAGTPIDGRPIESVRTGDTVSSYDPESGQIISRRVGKTFVSRPSSLVRVTIGTRSLVCTPGHPFLTSRGWVAAASLSSNDWVCTDANYIRNQSNDALRNLRSDSVGLRNSDEPSGLSRESLLLSGTPERMDSEECDATNPDLGAMYGVRKRSLGNWKADGSLPANRSSVLLAGTRAHLQPLSHERSCGAGARSSTVVRTDDTAQSYVHGRLPREVLSDTASNGAQAQGEGRKRTSDCPAEEIGRGSFLADGTYCTHPQGAWNRVSNALQDRCGESREEDRNRSRRLFAHVSQEQARRCEEGIVPSFARVDRVEVLEPGSDGRYGGLCSDGLVYNFEVEGTHTYLVDGIVVHNCHKAPDIARDSFGFRFTEGTVKSLARKVDNDAVAAAMTRSAGFFFSAMGSLRRDRARYKARLTPTVMGDHEKRAWADLAPALRDADAIFTKRTAVLQRDADAAESMGGSAHDREDINDKLAEVEGYRDRNRLVLDGLTVAMGEADPKGIVCYLDEDANRGQVSVCSKLVRASDALRPALFNKVKAPPPATTAPGGQPVTVIGASATLATGGSFAYEIEELGVQDPATLIAESPFRWPEQALFIVPEGLPDPNDKAFPDAVADTVAALITIAGGSLLGLFTSRKVLAHTYDCLVPSCRQQNINLFKQGDAPRTTLVQRFRDDRTSVLLGNESFWAGVDVPGDSLRVVVIDRLPFPNPDDPIVDALQQLNDRTFWAYSVPRAIIAFKQGAGRLIRSSSDRGVIVCCDNRIITKKYGKQFLKALPPMPKSTRLSSAIDWLNPPAWDEA